MTTAAPRQPRLTVAAVRTSVTQPRNLTLALAVALAVAGVALSWDEMALPLLTVPAGSTAVLGLAALAVIFFVTELGQALVEVRRHAYSFSLAGIPMVLGLFYFPPRELLAVRIVTSLVAFAVQKASPLKMAFNSASYLLDAALVLAVSHQLLGEGNTLTVRTAALCYLSVAVVDTLMSLLVLLVIRINQGPISRNESLEVMLPAAAFVLLNTGIGIIAALLLSCGPLGVVMLGLFGLMTGVVYRGYLVLRRRHQSLQVVQDFIEASGGTGTVEELAEAMLGRVRLLVRASRVELVLHDTDDTVTLRVRVDEDGPVTTGLPSRRATDRPDPDLGPDAAVLISARSINAQQRRWLQAHDANDALVVSLARAGTRGRLMALDRLGEATRFTDHDLALLQTLAGHLALAMESRQLVARLRHEATHDVLTGLPNRSLLTRRVNDALTSTLPGSAAAVLLLDLDRFKEVNDALGHHVGDELLKVVATRLAELRSMPGATVYRLGGDEFAVLLPAAADQASRAVAVAQRLATSLSTPIELPEVTLTATVSIGVAIAEVVDSHADLLRHADTAMYAAKAAGTAIALYTPDLDAGRGERLAMVAELHLALDRGELELYYQPKLDLAFNAVTSVEALARWTHPTLGVVPPDVFIPLAESTGLIERLTHQLLTKALRQCRAWQDGGLDLTVAVNLSARNVMNTDLPDQVAAALVAARLPAHKLILEITESSIMGDPDRTVPILERLSDIGVTLSLDDFGTGYSSLSYLQRLPVREVKIDRSFVAAMADATGSHSSEVLIKSIINLGSGLGLRIVAEGVETAEVLEELRQLGCDVIQGYYIGRPMPADQLGNSLLKSGMQTFGSVPRPRDGERHL